MDYEPDLEEAESPHISKTVAGIHAVADAARRTTQNTTLHSRPHPAHNAGGGALRVRDEVVGHGVAAQIQGIKRAMARLDTSVPIAVPSIPFSSDHNVSDLVHFTSALRNAVESARVACDDTQSVDWTRGWGKVLECHILRSCARRPLRRHR